MSEVSVADASHFALSLGIVNGPGPSWMGRLGNITRTMVIDDEDLFNHLRNSFGRI